GEPGPDRRVAPPGGAEGSRQPGAPAAVGGAQAAGQEAPMSNYAFFVKYTYSNECALLAYNFHELVTKLKIFDHFEYRHDHRLISVTLAYIFYRSQALKPGPCLWHQSHQNPGKSPGLPVTPAIHVAAVLVWIGRWRAPPSALGASLLLLGSASMAPA
ncbi:unnamed protein product, partial [Prorocentrum cordatum]